MARTRQKGRISTPARKTPAKGGKSPRPPRPKRRKRPGMGMCNMQTSVYKMQTSVHSYCEYANTLFLRGIEGDPKIAEVHGSAYQESSLHETLQGDSARLPPQG